MFLVGGTPCVVKRGVFFLYVAAHLVVRRLCRNYIP